MKRKKHFLVNLAVKGKGAILLLCLFVSILLPVEAWAQEDYDEVAVLLNAEGIGKAEIQAAILDEEAYLSVTELFSFLKIKNNPSPGFDSVSGFFINQNAGYIINSLQNNITYQGKVFDLNPGDLIRHETNLYLKLPRFGQVFGLQCAFHFRSLSVTLKTDLELPVILESRRDKMRRNLNRLHAVIEADTTIARRNPIFRLGMADWSVNSTQSLNLQTETEKKKDILSYTRAMLAFGANVAGGEANVRLQYIAGLPFESRNQTYQWRYVDNSNKLVRQVTIGRIAPQATVSLFAPVTGVQLSNASTIRRLSFGTYTLSDITTPDWIVELYINNVLIDYVRADANGYFTFDVPLVYGSSAVKLQIYGPWGEQQVIEKNFIIPFHFVPAGKLEYSLSSGMVEDESKNKYARGNLSYGVSRNLTVGGGVEYLSGLSDTPLMPFLNTSVSLAPGLVVSGEYIHEVRSKGVILYQKPSDLNLEITYTRYKDEQEAVFFNYLEERRFTISKPLRINKFRLHTQFALNQLVYARSSNMRAEMRLSGNWAGLSSSITNYAVLGEGTEPYFFSNISFTKKLPAKFNLLMQAQYDYTRSQFLSVRGGLEKRISTKAFFHLAFQKNIPASIKSIEAGFRYNFDFAQAGISGSYSERRITTTQSASGGIMFDQNAASVKTNARSNVGKGGLTILAFLDLNNNRKYDAGEKKVSNVNPRVKGGSLTYNERDTTYTVSNLQPYTDYILEVNQSNFQIISWLLTNKVIKVEVEPNHYKRIEVPVTVAGEVAGMLYNYNTPEMTGRIKINFYRDDKVLVGNVLTEDDGYFSYMGLEPGNYTARVDSAQLENIKLTTLQEASPFQIKLSTEGDLVDDLEIFIGKQEVNKVKK